MTTITIHPTRSLFKDKEHYLAFRKQWATACNDKEMKHSLTAEHHTLYAMFRGVDWTKGFTSCTNPNKLNNGRKPNDTLLFTLMSIKAKIKNADSTNQYTKEAISRLLKPFGGTITPEMFKALDTLIPSANEFGKDQKPYKIG